MVNFWLATDASKLSVAPELILMLFATAIEPAAVDLTVTLPEI